MLGLLLIPFLMCVPILITIIMRRADFKVWNDGICKETGKRWIVTELPSDGCEFISGQPRKKFILRSDHIIRELHWGSLQQAKIN